jgi:ribulose-phosphate 3-epimerase
VGAVIAPSILSADFARLGAEIKDVEAGGAALIHVDVMDGHFVPNITIGPAVTAAVRKVTALPVDCHLMIEEPDRYIEAFAKAGADMISVHVEVCRHLERTVSAIKDFGVKAGVVLNPATSLDTLEEILPETDFVLIMSVNPGFGGQSFIPHALDKLRAARKLVDAAIERTGRDILLEVDGGVKVDNIAEVARAGADTFVAGSAIFGAGDYRTTIDAMRAALSRVDRAS